MRLSYYGVRRLSKTAWRSCATVINKIVADSWSLTFRLERNDAHHPKSGDLGYHGSIAIGFLEVYNDLVTFSPPPRLMPIPLRITCLFSVAAWWLSFLTLQAEELVDFSRDIRPILSQNCLFCHGPDEKAREADLRLDIEEDAKRDLGGTKAIVPGKPEQSELIRRIESTNTEEVMPPAKLHKVITRPQIEIIKTWIRQGAKWGKHWSFEPVVRPGVPQNGEANPVDAFLLQRLLKENLAFSPEADRSTLVRRWALDITGLPPTLDEIELLATATHAEIVAHFMNQQAFGEHWARPWLDLARYADSAGYPSDPGREIWSYRDWVIRAFNDNMPFDQFTIQQLAGDLLPQPNDEQLIATAFHRNTMTNNEGGTNDEEFRTAAIIDRVNTTFAVWMGTTMACAQCHTHKYDPITQHEYFQVYAFLNQTADADKKDESPLHELIDSELKKDRDEWRNEFATIEAELKKLDSKWLFGFDDWVETKPAVREANLREALGVSKEERSEKQVKALQQYYVRNIAKETKPQRDQLTKLKKKLDGTKPVTVPILRDLEPSAHRKTFVQLRGNWQALGDEVQAGVPAVFPPLPKDAPRNRLGFAKWIASAENPLTARVAVNRMWEAVFGIGIVRSSEEFGSQGDLPEHPELLDWLAAEFIESGWDVKHLLALLFQSRAYRQVSKSSAELNERDPDNRWLARGPRFRPSGELLRDQALAVSQLLSNKMYGPPVRPVMPALGLKTAFGQGNDWEPSKGEDRHRRSIYTEVRRNNPYPSFNTFDAPNREVCTIRRGRSNTPLQAFVTLNDSVFVESHQALARRIVAEGGDTFEERVRWVFQVCLAREPKESDSKALRDVFDQAMELYRNDAELAAKMATDPIGPTPDGADEVSLAVWTAISSVVMNLDEFLMRR
jgi:mono/diheme cytochrome c family protein